MCMFVFTVGGIALSDVASRSDKKSSRGPVEGTGKKRYIFENF